MVKKREKLENDNYLDYIPVRNETSEWKTEESGAVTIFVENKGILQRVVRKFLDKPRFSQIHLEGMGNFVWLRMDGTRSIYEIAVLLKEYFGEQAEPLYPRLIQYIKILESYKLIRVKKNNV